MEKILTRREMLTALGAATAMVTACGGDNTVTGPSASGTSTSTPTTAASGTCAVTPTETLGPYPSRTDTFRSDIRRRRAAPRSRSRSAS